jgi:hypothetical protein
MELYMPIRKLSASDQEYYLISFDAEGNERTDDPDGMMSQRIIDVLANEPITDVFLISHGWLGDVNSAIDSVRSLDRGDCRTKC